MIVYFCSIKPCAVLQRHKKMNHVLKCTQYWVLLIYLHIVVQFNQEDFKKIRLLTNGIVPGYQQLGIAGIVFWVGLDWLFFFKHESENGYIFTYLLWGGTRSSIASTSL